MKISKIFGFGLLILHHITFAPEKTTLKDLQKAVADLKQLQILSNAAAPERIALFSSDKIQDKHKCHHHDEPYDLYGNFSATVSYRNVNAAPIVGIYLESDKAIASLDREHEMELSLNQSNFSDETKILIHKALKAHPTNN